MALQLSSLYQPPLLLLPTEVRRPARHPWAHLMAALVVAGGQAWEASFGVPLRRCMLTAGPAGPATSVDQPAHACSQAVLRPGWRRARHAARAAAARVA